MTDVWSVEMFKQKNTIRLVTLFSLIAVTGVSAVILGNMYVNQKIFETKNFSEFFQTLDVDYFSNITHKLLVEDPFYEEFLGNSQVIDIVHAQEDKKFLSLPELFEKSEKIAKQMAPIKNVRNTKFSFFITTLKFLNKPMVLLKNFLFLSIIQ